MEELLKVCVIMLVLGCPTTKATQQPVENTPLYNHGMLFEKLDDVQLIFGEWVLQFTINLNSLKKRSACC